MKTQLYVDFDSRHPDGLTVRINVNGDWVDFASIQEKTEHWLHARVALAQAVGLGMLWPPGVVAVVGAVSMNGDGRAILGCPMTPLEKVGAGVVLANVAANLTQVVQPPVVTEDTPE